MKFFLSRLFCSPALVSLALSCSLSYLIASPAQAQANAPQGSASAAANGDDKNIPDWVKKQADNPIKWIIQQDPKAKTKPAVDEKAAAAAAAKKAAAAAARKARAEEIPVVSTRAVTPTTNTNTNTTAPVSSNAVTTAAPVTSEPATPPPAPAPEPVATPAVAALSPEPEPKELPKPLLADLIPISQPQPNLPREFLQSGARAGRVVVNFTVNPDGSVSDAAISESSDRLLNRAVLSAVKQWIYKPIAQSQPNSAVIAFQLD
jgi:TonB family protein